MHLPMLSANIHLTSWPSNMVFGGLLLLNLLSCFISAPLILKSGENLKLARQGSTLLKPEATIWNTDDLTKAPKLVIDIALCQRLKSLGHSCAIATHLKFKSWIEKSGFEFREVEGDPQEAGQLIKVALSATSFKLMRMFLNITSICK